MKKNFKIAVVIPCYRVKDQIIDVLAEIPDFVDQVYVIDDLCPEGTGEYVIDKCLDSRIKVIFNDINLGVGGATMRGYRQAINDGYEVMVKIDGDGQMDPSLIEDFVSPILSGKADYTKGNRFFYLDEIYQMPTIRIIGNSVLSFITKFSSGYWDVFDPTNGFTAIHASVARQLNFEKISFRYFFESDILFRLNLIRAVVLDIPMHSKYGNEKSNLKIKLVVLEFFYKNIKNLIKRIFYSYFLRGMSVASLELPLGILMVTSGLFWGGYYWYQSIMTGIPAPAGRVMLAALPLMMGLQFILAFLAYDISMTPKNIIQKNNTYG